MASVLLSCTSFTQNAEMRYVLCNRPVSVIFDSKIGVTERRFAIDYYYAHRQIGCANLLRVPVKNTLA